VYEEHQAVDRLVYPETNQKKKYESEHIDGDIFIIGKN
jgi:hypothetical protein